MILNVNSYSFDFRSCCFGLDPKQFDYSKIKVSNVLNSSQSYFVKKTIAKNQSEALNLKVKLIGSERLHSPIIAVRVWTIGVTIIATIIRTIVTALD